MVFGQRKSMNGAVPLCVAGACVVLLMALVSSTASNRPQSTYLAATVTPRASMRPGFISSPSSACAPRNVRANAEMRRMGRKSFLLATGGVTASSIFQQQLFQSRAERDVYTGTTPVDKLVPGQKSAQRTDLYIVLKAKIGEFVKSPYTSVMQLVLLDALKRDKSSKTGGLDGSIQYELDDLKLPELKQTVKELNAAKDAVNKEWQSEDKLTFVDVLVFSGYLKTAQEFNRALVQRSTNGGGQTIASGFGNPFPVPPLGRADASKNEGKKIESTSVADLANTLKSLGFATRDIAALSICFPGSEDLANVEAALSDYDPKVAGAIKSAQQSRRTVTQNSYQVNVGEAYNKLVTFGQPAVNPLAYYYPAPKFDISKVKL